MQFHQKTNYFIVEFLLEGWGKVSGHLSNSVAGSVAHPRMLRKGKKKPNSKICFNINPVRFVTLGEKISSIHYQLCKPVKFLKLFFLQGRSRRVGQSWRSPGGWPPSAGGSPRRWPTAPSARRDGTSSQLATNMQGLISLCDMFKIFKLCVGVTHGSAASAWCAVWSWAKWFFLPDHRRFCPERSPRPQHYWWGTRNKPLKHI